MTSWRPNDLVKATCCGDCDSFHSGFTAGCGWMLWLVGSLLAIWKLWPVITPTTRGRYMQPFWSRVTAVAGIAHCWPAGSPGFTQTKTFFRVPLGVTTTSSLFFAAPLWARSQAGLADMSRIGIFGCSPTNATLPVMMPPLASSGTAGGQLAAGADASVCVAGGAPGDPSRRGLGWAGCEHRRSSGFLVRRVRLGRPHGCTARNHWGPDGVVWSDGPCYRGL